MLKLTKRLRKTARTEIYCSPEFLRVEQHGIVVPRPCLYRLLYNQIPPHKLRNSKRIISLLQNNEGVMIGAADCTSYHGDILVGADGASSSVRQELYKSLQKKVVDIYGQEQCYLLVGIDTDTRAIVKEKSVPLITVGPQAHDQMAKEVYEFKTIYGKLGDLIDQTPRESLDGQSLEVVLFDIWHPGRTVLIGDAAHQAIPSNSASTLHAIQDAVALANCIYDIKRFSHTNISAGLKAFKDQRYPQTRAHFIQDKLNASLNKKFFFSNVLRKLKGGRTPWRAIMRERSNQAFDPPRCKFLPLAPERGTALAQSQKFIPVNAQDH
ncbi:hypothetical protein BGZ72_008859 [Mortierella alpina]|nr:hypothetical protein BGZ72_008859 [Mortierella alpina]